MEFCLSFWTRLALRFAVPAATVLVAAFVALITFFQWRTNRQKLRLDLYQHRFEVYLRVLEFHMAVLEWQDEANLALLHGPFLKAFCESKFLFPQKSGIHDLLGEYNGRTARVRASKGRPEFSNQASPAERAQLAEDEKWIRNLVGTLDEKLGPYLNFNLK
jgi:hypothetical protein